MAKEETAKALEETDSQRIFIITGPNAENLTEEEIAALPSATINVEDVLKAQALIAAGIPATTPPTYDHNTGAFK